MVQTNNMGGELIKNGINNLPKQVEGINAASLLSNASKVRK